MFNARHQQGDITAEFIDDHTDHPGAFVVCQQGECAVNRGEHTTAIDIRHQDHRCVYHLRHAHIHNVAVAQIDLRRAARTFQHNDVVLRSQVIVNIADHGFQLWFVEVILRRIHILRDFPHQDNLGFAVRGRFEQNRVHAHIRFYTGSFRLKDLRPAHLFAVTGDPRVQCHIL